MVLAILLNKLYCKLKQFFIQLPKYCKESEKEDSIGTNNSSPFSKDTGSKVIHYMQTMICFLFLIKNSNGNLIEIWSQFAKHIYD